MIDALARKIFGSRNERLLNRMTRQVQRINALEATYEKLSDAELQAKTAEFKQRLADGASLESLLVEAFAAVREASKRTLGMRHYDVQLLGGMVLNQGKIAEMHTGEGKTLVATLPLYLNALAGKGAHLVTVNDYLAKRDATQMGEIYQFLGMSVGVILTNLSTEARREAYACDITYGTNNEFGFDYLRDNMAFSLADQVQRPLAFAVVDEVDSILIDEARTPLIISGPAEDNIELYSTLTKLIPRLEKQMEKDGPGDYTLDEKSKQAHLTDAGHQRLEEMLLEAGILQEGESLYSPTNITLMHYVSAVLRAHTLYQRDVDYMVKDNQILIVDEHTGRAMPGRRWSDGLHQAIEAKEGVSVQGENQTLASITFQNYFRLYEKLSGMTGTADTEAYEFHHTYGLEVVVMPTNKPMVRQDYPDFVFLKMKDKFGAILKDIKACQARQQPVLVGTASIETSEYLSQLLTKAKVPHAVLNAKHHEREAHIIAEAGRPGAVTIATNMAGRGTDIILGGSWQAEVAAMDAPTAEDVAKIKVDWQKRHDVVINAGGLHIIGSERHEARRIDNQLRGRSGRQGDPGSSRFYLSLEDNLVRIFVSESMAKMMARLGMGDGEPLESKLVSKQIAKAQKKVEQHHYDIRKQLLAYDDAANDQRRVIYDQRQYLLSSEDITELLDELRRQVVSELIAQYIPSDSVEEQWDLEGLAISLKEDFALALDVKQLLDVVQMDMNELHQKILDTLIEQHRAKVAIVEVSAMRQFEKNVMLQCLDTRWREHLNNMDHLRNSIGLRGYAQKDPKQEYKKESFFLFENMLSQFQFDVVTTIAKVQVQTPEQVAQAQANWQQKPVMNFEHAELNELDQSGSMTSQNVAGAGVRAVVSNERKPGRNEACPCGSGKKYKHCHGRL